MCLRTGGEAVEALFDKVWQDAGKIGKESSDKNKGNPFWIICAGGCKT
jgi:hypothetical protein